MATQRGLTSWVEVEEGSDFPIQNLPFGVFKKKCNGDERIGVAIGKYILDLYEVTMHGLFNNTIYLKNGECFLEKKLNKFMSLERNGWKEARNIIQYLLLHNTADIQCNNVLRNKCLILQSSVDMLLPCYISDYTDFYSSKNHAFNVGTMFRGKKNALQPNWLHLPVGYHGRSSSVVVSGTDIHRPYGQILPNNQSKIPQFSQCQRLDIELEVGFFVGGKLPKNIGQPININNAFDNIFGMVLLNDWSARDIQKWEYIPLGPFNAKNFATSISPWIITIDALQPFIIDLPEQKPNLLPYLNSNRKDFLFDVDLNVYIQSKKMESPQLVCESNTKYLYYSCHQQLTHHAITGCNFNPGDLLGSGTISGTKKNSFGSLLELTWNGSQPLLLNDGTQRKFLNDFDKIIISGNTKKHKQYGFKIGFGKCEGVILPSKPLNSFLSKL